MSKKNKEVEQIIEDKLEDLKEEFETEIKEEIIETLDERDQEIDNLNNKLKELEEKVLRMSAENINYRRRKDDEVSRMLKYSNEDIVLEILPVVDNFERALNSCDENSEFDKFISGFKMIYASLINILTKYEVTEIDALDKVFDPNYHEGVLTECDKDKEDGVVLEVLLKGYMLKDKVIRPSMVKINEL